MIEDGKVHGKGKRINPNQMIQEGSFNKGIYIEDKNTL